MTRIARSRSAALLLLVLLSACADRGEAGDRGPMAPRDSVVAFVDVDVVPMDTERVLRGQTVLVREGRIAAVGPVAEVEVPAGARRVAGTGLYLMPGLAEMHAHIPGGADDELTRTVLFLYLANGITTIRGMLGDPAHLELRELAARDQLLSPRIYTSGPPLSGNSVTKESDARRAVRKQAEAGYDFLKLLPGLSRASFDAIAEEAERLGIDFAGHVSADVGLRRTLQAAQATIDHLDSYVEALVPDDSPVPARESRLFGFNLAPHADTSRIGPVARSTREAGVWNVPTMSLFPDLVRDPAELEGREDVRYMPRSMVDQWRESIAGLQSSPNFSAEAARRFLELRRAILAGLHESGAGLLLGSDAPQVFNVPGFSMHEELAELIAAGLSPYEALRTGSVEVARFYDALDARGTVEVGKEADLILTRGDPLADVANVREPAGVMVRGRWLSGEEIGERLEEIAARYGN